LIPYLLSIHVCRERLINNPGNRIQDDWRPGITVKRKRENVVWPKLCCCSCINIALIVLMGST
jgi:hypothetical protein